MKYVVIGGGIAGLAIGAFLYRKGKEVVVCEKQSSVTNQGHAFLLHADAVSILEELNLNRSRKLPGETIRHFSLRRPAGIEVRTEALEGWTCMKRTDLLEFMDSLIHPGTLRRGRNFSHFLRDRGRIVAAVFSNGAIENGDIFIGCDGGKSKVREAIFGSLPATTIMVKEVVGITKNSKLWPRHQNSFVKFQHDQYGLSFGMIPTGPDEFVWFMQFDPCRGDISASDPEQIRKFVTRNLAGFPSEVSELLESNDFTRTYVWNTRDFDLLPAFHRDNIVLVGDAAHQALPFSSSGTTNAIVGAATLSHALDHSLNLETAFQQYYFHRAPVIREHVRIGRELRAAFLHPAARQARTPLALSPSINRGLRPADKGEPHYAGSRGLHHAGSQEPRPSSTQPARVFTTPGGRKSALPFLTVKYFTDPICSTCWIIQPALKKMSLEYGPYLDIKYYMGGLLPSWDTCEGKIKSPTDAARLWKDVNDIYNMPIDGDIWLEDPLSSSFPPSIAVKAAQLQDEQKAVLFLRRIREMLFLEKKNIMRWRHLEAAAAEVGLNLLAFAKAYDGQARIAFQQDLRLARQLDVRSFPHIIFSNSIGQHIRLKGHIYYEDLEKAILELNPDAHKRLIDPRPGNLFRHFPTMLEEEFAMLGGLMTEEARKLLRKLNEGGYIQQMPTQKGVLYKAARF